MVDMDILEIPYRHPIIMSAHPLEGRAQKEDIAATLRSFLDELKKQEVKAVNLLLSREEFLANYDGIDLIREYSEAGLEVIHFPLENFGTPEGLEVYDSLISRLSAALLQGKVLIHCRKGCSRTTLVAAGVLIKHDYTAAKAITTVHSVRPTASNFTINQIQFLRDYQRYCAEK